MNKMQSEPNATIKSISAKFDCAKECPCGVAAIPVPDQWLELTAIGGFKVWHILFIVIALTISMAILYCCLHRCRIPRTKQEIETDLMRTTMANKFKEHLLEMPSDVQSFIEALKRVQELEEKIEEENAIIAMGASARKRKGWLKLKDDGPTIEQQQQIGSNKPEVEATEKTEPVGLVETDVGSKERGFQQGDVANGHGAAQVEIFNPAAEIERPKRSELPSLGQRTGRRRKNLSRTKPPRIQQRGTKIQSIPEVNLSGPLNGPE